MCPRRLTLLELLFILGFFIFFYKPPPFQKDGDSSVIFNLPIFIVTSRLKLNYVRILRNFENAYYRIPRMYCAVNQRGFVQVEYSMLYGVTSISLDAPMVRFNRAAIDTYNTTSVQRHGKKPIIY
jgi:hypothetical protein